MNIKIFIILFAIVLVSLVGYVYNTDFMPTITKNSDKDFEIVEKQNEKVVSSDEVAAKLCKTSFLTGFDYYPSAVHKCESYYEVFAPRDVLDGGSTIVDENGNEAAMCGGLPNPSDIANPLCQLNCDRYNLCEGVVIDCTSLLPGPKDSCNMENAIRTKDSKFCDLLTTDRYDIEGCREYVQGE